MSAFEQAIRPFAGTTVTPPSRVVTSERPVFDVLVEVTGGAGKIQTYNWSSAFNINILESETEIARETTTRRVENPDDPDQYVIVEDAKKMTMRDEKGKKSTWLFQ